MPTESTPLFMTVTQPSVVLMVKRANIEFNILSKLMTGLVQIPP